LPSAGICLVFGTLVGKGSSEALGSPSPRPSPEGRGTWRPRALLFIALLFSGRAILRNAVWWTDEGLFANLIATSPESAKAHYDVAYIAVANRRYGQALAEYSRAVEIYPRYWDAWAGRGRTLRETGNLAEAERSYEKAIAANGDYENGYFGLGEVREARGDVSGAANAYRSGLKKKPTSLPLA